MIEISLIWEESPERTPAVRGCLEKRDWVYGDYVGTVGLLSYNSLFDSAFIYGWRQ